MKKLKLALLAVTPAALMAAMPAHAALDASISTAITGAQTDLLALLGALTAAGVAIWVGRVIYNHFRVK